MAGELGKSAKPKNRPEAACEDGRASVYSVSDTANVTFEMFALARQSRTLITRS